MASTSGTTLSAREQAVMREVFKRTTFTFTADEWKSIASKAGVTEGDTARNAKYALSCAKKKLGAGSAAEESDDTNAKPSPKRKLGKSTGKDSEDNEDVSPTKKTKAGRGKASAKVKDEGFCEE